MEILKTYDKVLPYIGNFTYEQPINTFHKYVMDLNILLDLIKKRQNYKDVAGIIKCTVI